MRCSWRIHANCASPATGCANWWTSSPALTLSCEADSLSAEHASQAQAELRQRLRRFATLGGIAFDAWDVAVPWQRALIGHLAGARAA